MYVIEGESEGVSLTLCGALKRNVSIPILFVDAVVQLLVNADLMNAIASHLFTSHSVDLILVNF
jgi:hypothetical protein